MTVRELVEETRAGDPSATLEVRRRLAAGDAEVTREVGTRLAAGDSELGKRLMAPMEALDAFQADLLNAKDLTTSKPGTTGPLMEALEVRARRLGRCQTVQVLGLNAMRFTLLGDLSGARETLGRARGEAGGCPACELDAMRREALLLLHLGEVESALEVSQRAMDGYQTFGAPGHDLNGDGWASSLIARAQIRCQLGDLTGSAADCALALQHFPKGTKVWRVTQQNLASTLALAGPVERRQVSTELASLRRSMRKGVTVERACFLWMDGQLVISIGERRYLGLDRLLTSLRIYRHPTIATPGPWLGVASDYSRCVFPDRDRIAAFLQREVAPHAQRLIKDDVHHEQLRELFALAATRRPTSATWPSLRRAIESLRGAAAGLMPCLLPPWPEGG